MLGSPLALDFVHGVIVLLTRVRVGQILAGVIGYGVDSACKPGLVEYLKNEKKEK